MRKQEQYDYRLQIAWGRPEPKDGLHESRRKKKERHARKRSTFISLEAADLITRLEENFDLRGQLSIDGNGHRGVIRKDHIEVHLYRDITAREELALREELRKFKKRVFGGNADLTIY